MSPSSRDPTDLTTALAELVNLMLATPSMEEFLDGVAGLAGEVITPTAACGITLRRNTDPWTIANNGALASRLDEVQYGLDDGPCLQSLRTGQIVDVADLSTETRWGAYRSHALGYGVRSSLSLPLQVDGDTRGALNLYATEPNAFGATARTAAELFATQAANMLTIVHRQARQWQLSAQLREALASRSVIDQAIGIVMEQRHCAATAAFNLLRGLSQQQNRKLRAVAADIVAAVGGQPPEPPRFNDPATQPE
jgi:GAF domain-containing protein